MYPKRDTGFSIGHPDAPVRVIIFHGYTGSTDEFEMLAHTIHAETGAFVSVPLLPGHGTNEADLLHLDYDTFARFAHEHASHVRGDAAKLVLMGHSFGGYLALECAAAFQAQAIVLTVVPFWLRAPLNLPGIPWFMRRKLLWNKKLPLQERIERIGLFYYRHMPGIALTLLKEGIRRSKGLLHAVTCPILAINTTKDPLAYQHSGEALLKRSGRNPNNRLSLVERQDHGLFYGAGREQVVDEIAAFIKQATR